MIFQTARFGGDWVNRSDTKLEALIIITQEPAPNKHAAVGSFSKMIIEASGHAVQRPDELLLNSDA